MEKKVLLVEDAKSLADAVSTKLTNEGFEVVYSDNGVNALEELSTDEFDIMLLDINMPKMDGFQVAKAVNELGYKPKIIALTARDSIDDKLKGFDLGFDDYVVKPFDMRELVARMNAVLRTRVEKRARCYEVGDLSVDVSARSIKSKNKAIELTKLEFDLFVLLLDDSPSVVKNEDIVEKLWKESSEDVAPPIRSHIKNLRRKIGDKDFSLIVTVPGVGYKIVERVICQDH